MEAVPDVPDVFALIGMGTTFVWLGTHVFGYLQRFQRQPPEPLTDEDIERVAREGDMATAVRWHRTLHGSSLPDAKAAVEEL